MVLFLLGKRRKTDIWKHWECQTLKNTFPKYTGTTLWNRDSKKIILNIISFCICEFINFLSISLYAC